MEFVDKSSADEIFKQEVHKIKGKKVECKPFGVTKLLNNVSDQKLFDNVINNKVKNVAKGHYKKGQRNTGYVKGGTYDSDLSSDLDENNGDFMIKKTEYTNLKKVRTANSRGSNYSKAKTIVTRMSRKKEKEDSDDD